MNVLTFLRERSRLTNNCAIKCEDCRLSKWNSGKDCSCSYLEQEHPELYVSIIQQWSEDCPRKTYKDVFLEAFPNAQLSETGEPRACLNTLRVLEVIQCLKFSGCVECWNQIVK